MAKDFDFNAVLAAAENGKKAEKKGKVPILSVTAAVKGMVSRFIQAKEKEETAKAEREMVEAQLLDAIEPDRAALCKRDFSKSVKIPGMDDRTVNVVWQDRYKDISDLGIVRKIVGKAFGNYFKENIVVTVKSKVTEDELRSIMAAVGPERFPELFDVVRKTEPTSLYTERFFMDFNDKQREQLKDLVPQYKPSIRK